MSPRTPTLPPISSEYHWKKLMNFLYVREQDAFLYVDELDALFERLRTVRTVVEEAERQRRGEAA